MEARRAALVLGSVSVGLVVLTSCLAGCAVVEDESGAGGGGPGTTSHGDDCVAPEPPATAFIHCDGGGDSNNCEWTCGGAEAGSYKVRCSGSTCSCLYNDDEKCTCTAPNACEQGQPHCCPAPWRPFFGG